MNQSFNKKVISFMQTIRLNERRSNNSLTRINATQLHKEEIKELDKKMPSRNQKLRRKLKIKSKKRSYSFLRWLFNNNEK